MHTLTRVHTHTPRCSGDLVPSLDQSKLKGDSVCVLSVHLEILSLCVSLLFMKGGALCGQANFCSK